LLRNTFDELGVEQLQRLLRRRRLPTGDGLGAHRLRVGAHTMHICNQMRLRILHLAEVYLEQGCGERGTLASASADTCLASAASASRLATCMQGVTGQCGAVLRCRPTAKTSRSKPRQATRRRTSAIAAPTSPDASSTQTEEKGSQCQNETKMTLQAISSIYRPGI